MGTAYPNNQHPGHGHRRALHLRVAGFTLPELIIGVGIVALLASLAAPGMSDLIGAQRARAAGTDLYLALSKARSEAIKRNTNVTLSPKGGSWGAGWEIIDPFDASIRLEDHNPLSNVTITGPSSVVYQSTGRVRGSTRPEFDISVTGASSAVCVTVDLSGLPSQKSSSC